MHIGQKLAEARKSRGMSPEELAKRINENVQYVLDMENRPQIEENELQKLAAAVGVTSDFIRNFQSEPKRPLIDHQEIHSREAVGLINGGNQVNYPVEQLIDFFKRLIQEKDEQIERLKGSKK